MVDYKWCLDNPATAAEDINELRARLVDAENVLRCIEIAPTMTNLAIAGYRKRHPGNSANVVPTNADLEPANHA